jgi:hypothetical protein
MQITVTTIIFGLPSGQRLLQTRCVLPASTLTVRQLIAHKVQQEVAECVAQQRPGLSGEFFSPEALIRADTPAALVPGDVSTEVERAQQAFVTREYMIVINNRRVFDPEEVLVLHPESQVEFIKILPLVGG